jgi:hypothetical protein
MKRYEMERDMGKVKGSLLGNIKNVVIRWWKGIRTIRRGEEWDY